MSSILVSFLSLALSPVVITFFSERLSALPLPASSLFQIQYVRVRVGKALSLLQHSWQNLALSESLTYP